MSRALRTALQLAMLFGVCLRIYEFAVHPPTLWQDEAYWAVKALKTEAIDAQIRPFGFMLSVQFLLRVFGASARVYRLLPFVGSLVSMVVAPYVATRLFKRPWTQLLSVLLLAVSPVALEMAIEFKHYGTEIGAYMGTLAALLYYLDRGTWRSLALALGVAWFSFFYSITIIFFYPALFCVLAYRAFRSKDFRRLLVIGGVAALCLGTITTIYFTTWRTIHADKAEKKWGTWYDVFYLQNGLRTTHDSRLTWTTAKYFELAATPGVDRQLWRSARVSESTVERLKLSDLVLWGALHVAGVAWLVRRRRFEELALLWSPLLLVTIFNLAGRWPAGAFRSNAFFVPFAILLCSYSAEWLPDDSLNRRRLGFALGGLLWLSAVLFRPSLLSKGLWTKPGAVTEALALLPLNPAKDARTLVMDYETCRPWDYYTVYDVPFAHRGSKLHHLYKKACQRTGKQLRSQVQSLKRSGVSGFSMLVTDPRKFPFMEDLAKEFCDHSTTSYVHDRTHLLIICKQNKQDQ